MRRLGPAVVSLSKVTTTLAGVLVHEVVERRLVRLTCQQANGGSAHVRVSSLLLGYRVGRTPLASDRGYTPRASVCRWATCGGRVLGVMGLGSMGATAGVHISV